VTPVVAWSNRKLGDVVWAWSTIAHPVAPSVTTETGKIPRSSRSTWTSRSSSRRVTRWAKFGESGSSAAMVAREVAVLALQLVDLVEELAGLPDRGEDAVLLTPDVPIEVGDEALQTCHRR